MRSLEREKFKYQDRLTDYININSDYLLFVNPLKILVELDILKVESNKLIINKKYFKNLSKLNLIKKKIKHLSLLEKKQTI